MTPAAEVPGNVAKKGKLIIVNLQKTPYDKAAHIKINAMCDDVMKLLVEKLKLKVENFILHRMIEFKLNKSK